MSSSYSSSNICNQDVRREERERNQRERQQVSRHSQQRHEESVHTPHQVSASLLFDTPIKKEKPDETSKRIEKTLGDFNQVSKYLMSSDHKQIIGISTHEIQRKNKVEGDKAKIEQILKEIKGLPPITGLDDYDHDNNGNNLDSNPTTDNHQHNRNHHSTRNDRTHFLDERSSSGVSDDESSRLNNSNSNSGYHNKQSTKNDPQNRFVSSQSHDWGSKRHNEVVNQGSDHNEPLSKKVRKTSESNLHPRHHHHHHHPKNSLSNGTTKVDRNKLNLSGNESSSASSRSSSSDSDSDSASSDSDSSDNESMADVTSHNMSGQEEGDEVDVMKTRDNHRGGGDRHLAIESNFPVTTTAEVDNPVGSWNLMSFMHKDPSKNEPETSPKRGEEEGSRISSETVNDKYIKTINKVAVGLPSPPILSSPSSSSPDDDSPSINSPIRRDSGVKQRKTNNSLSAPLSASIIPEVVHKSSKQSKVNEGKDRRVETTEHSSRATKLSVPGKTTHSSPPRLTSRDCGPGNKSVPKCDLSSKSKRPTPRKVSPAKQSVPSKENYKPTLVVESEMKDTSNKGNIKSMLPEIVPKQLICSIDCNMLKRIPKGGVNGKKEPLGSSLKKDHSKHHHHDRESNRESSRNGNHCLSPSSASQKLLSSKPSLLFSPNDRKSQQKSDVSSPKRVPSSATKKDPSSSPSHPSSSPPSMTLSSSSNPPSSSTTNRSQPSSQTGPLVPLSGPVLPTSLSSESLNSSTNDSNETSPEYCMMNAKKLKHAADGENERTAKFCKYIESVLFYIMYGHAKESNPSEVLNVYRDTSNLLVHTTEIFKKGCNTSTSASDNKLLALSHRCQSFMNSTIYKLRLREKSDNHRIIKEIKPNTNEKPGEVMIPTSSYYCMKKQLDLFKNLDLAFNSWLQVDVICQKHPSCKAFFDTLDKECVPLSLTSNAEDLVSYVRTGLKLLR